MTEWEKSINLIWEAFDSHDAIKLGNAIECLDLDSRNCGASVTAGLLAEIARTGEHHGVFSGKDIEDAAQAIMALHRKISDLKYQLCHEPL